MFAFLLYMTACNNTCFTHPPEKKTGSAKQILIDSHIIIFEHIEDNSDPAAGFPEIAGDCFHGNLRCPFVWKHKDPGGNTAQCESLDIVLIRQFQDRSVAGSQQPFVFFGQPTLNDRTYRMDNIFARKVNPGVILA
jgi:hypothetical protein